MPPYARPEAQQRELPAPCLPPLRIDNIARFDNWDKRECAISNPDDWIFAANQFAAQHNGPVPIPRHIHQIWIGTREPPCVWLDSWRLDFMAAHGTGWRYTLWDNEAVAALRHSKELLSASIYDREPMWQCKADLLRLELLYRHGGVYIDADMVSLGKSLEAVRASAEATGFGVSYEADTKDKPYSILGNSIIFAAKGHPLLRLLIEYIRRIYDAKRPHFGVEWVTGPLAFTKALLFSGMPLTLIPRDYFYAAFQYVPDPGAVDVSHFPNSLGFQFGYTCSGLADWVKNNNVCRRAPDCPAHKHRTDYALGSIEPFPEAGDCAEGGAIPKTIHQFQLSANPPRRWTDSWAASFCAANPGWAHRLWGYDDLRRLAPFFCAHRYPGPGRRMDSETLRLLALEVLFREGGYYVPLTAVYAPDTGRSGAAFPPCAQHGLAAAPGGVVGGAPRSRALLAAIRGAYELGKVPKLVRAGTPALRDVLAGGFADGDAAYLAYPRGSRFLGAGELHFPRATASAALVFGYDAQVPIFPFDGSLARVAVADGSAVVVTDAEPVRTPRVLDAVPGLLYHAAQADPAWDFLVLCARWGCGADGEAVARADGARLECGARAFGVAVNAGRAGHLAGMDGAALVLDVLGRAGNARVYVGTVQFEHSAELSAIYAAMGAVGDWFWRAAQHSIPGWERDETEVSGRLLKGLRGHQVAFEISADEDGRVMYRAFNDDGGINCEVRATDGVAQTTVESMRVYYDHQIVFERNGFALPRAG